MTKILLLLSIVTFSATVAGCCGDGVYGCGNANTCAQLSTNNCCGNTGWY